MPATPAWPPGSLIRLFVDQPLADATTLTIEGGQAHYLAGVMRVQAGDHVALFDDISGEWRATVEEVARRQVRVRIDGKLREREAVPDLWLLAAPIKKGRIDWMARPLLSRSPASSSPSSTARPSS